MDVAVCAAAVSDFKPVVQNKNKLKKNQNSIKPIKIEKNKDVLEYLGKNNVHRPKLVVGFSDCLKSPKENDCCGLSMISLFSSIGSASKFTLGIVFSFLLSNETIIEKVPEIIFFIFKSDEKIKKVKVSDNKP